MSEEGKIGMNGLDMSGSHRSATNECRKGGRNVMARSIGVEPARPVRRRAKTIGLLLVFGVAIFVVSAMSLAPAAKSKMPADIADRPPGTPYSIAGYTYDALGVKLPSCTVVVTDVTQGLSSPTLTSSGTTAFYSTQLQTWCPDWEVGDELKVVATKGIMYGENTSLVGSGPGTVINVTLNLEIPEFPVVVVPIVGMMGLFVAMTVIRRRD